jgi:hypothetical protein
MPIDVTPEVAYRPVQQHRPHRPHRSPMAVLVEPRPGGWS